MANVIGLTYQLFLPVKGTSGPVKLPKYLYRRRQMRLDTLITWFTATAQIRQVRRIQGFSSHRRRIWLHNRSTDVPVIGNPRGCVDLNICPPVENPVSPIDQSIYPSEANPARWRVQVIFIRRWEIIFVRLIA